MPPASGLIAAKLLYIAVSVGLPKAVVLFGRGDFSLLSGGGSVFYGGVIGGILGLFVARWIAKISLEVFTDVSGSMPTVGAAFRPGRLFLRGVLLRHPVRRHRQHPLSRIGTRPVAGCARFPDTAAVLPVQSSSFIALLFLSRRIQRPVSAFTGLSGRLCRGALFLGFLRGDAIRASLWGLSTSQWISLGILAAVFTLPPVAAKKNRGSAAV